MSSLPKPRYTPQQYLEMERRADYKSEFTSGEIFAMAGASREHVLIVTNLVRQLSAQTPDRPCETYSNDMKVKVNALGDYNYPDVVVACGDIAFEDNHRDTLVNPLVIVEVLSPSTEHKDRGTKFLQYQWIESLTDYVLVSQDRVLVERFARQPDDNWLYTRLEGTDAVLSLPSIGCRVTLAEVYARVRLAANAPGPE